MWESPPTPPQEYCEAYCEALHRRLIRPLRPLAQCSSALDSSCRFGLMASSRQIQATRSTTFGTRSWVSASTSASGHHFKPTLQTWSWRGWCCRATSLSTFCGKVRDQSKAHPVGVRFTAFEYACFQLLHCTALAFLSHLRMSAALFASHVQKQKETCGVAGRQPCLAIPLGTKVGTDSSALIFVPTQRIGVFVLRNPSCSLQKK